LIWGQFDNITPITQAHHLQELIPGSELVVIPNSGHVPMVEEPASFKRELVNALPLIVSDSRQIN
jgi:pimeloyl-ACP methyl ester carboxylesterase